MELHFLTQAQLPEAEENDPVVQGPERTEEQNPDEMPSAEQPAADQQPAVEEDPAAEENPAAGEGSAVDEGPSIEEEPGEQPAAEENPADQKESQEGEEEKASEPEDQVPEETQGVVTQPFPIPLPDGVTPNMVYAGAALLAALVVAGIAVMLRKRNAGKKVRKSTTTVDLQEPDATTAPAAKQKIFVACHQDIGAREDQQDSYGVSSPAAYAMNGVMAVVADGMGGLSNGSVVSGSLVRCLLDGFRGMSGKYGNAADMLLEQAARANNYINQILRGADRSGSTLLCAVVRDGYLNFLTVGDSRIYLYRGGALLQLNREHIYQEELAVRALNQTLPIQQVRGDRQAKSLTSYFGIGRIPLFDRNDEPIRLVPGDRIMLATDGIFGTLSAGQMEQALQQDLETAAKMMGDMVRQANRPYQDNNTAVILEYRD